MSRSYRLTPEAQAQFVAIGEFVAQDSIEAALNLYDALEGAFEQLAAMPEMGHTREDHSGVHQTALFNECSTRAPKSR